MNTLKVIVAGFIDGWTQPRSLWWSTSVPDEYQETLDNAINWGQLLRAGRKSQAYREGYLPRRVVTK